MLLRKLIYAITKPRNLPDNGACPDPFFVFRLIVICFLCSCIGGGLLFRFCILLLFLLLLSRFFSPLLFFCGAFNLYLLLMCFLLLWCGCRNSTDDRNDQYGSSYDLTPKS